MPGWMCARGEGRGGGEGSMQPEVALTIRCLELLPQVSLALCLTELQLNQLRCLPQFHPPLSLCSSPNCPNTALAPFIFSPPPHSHAMLSAFLPLELNCSFRIC